MTRLSKFSTRELQAEINKREKQRQEREYAKLCEQYPCPECGGKPVEMNTEATEEFRFAPRDPDGFPMLYAPYEMGETHGMAYQTTGICENGHTWRLDPTIKWFEKPMTGPPLLGRGR